MELDDVRAGIHYLSVCFADIVTEQITYRSKKAPKVKELWNPLFVKFANMYAFFTSAVPYSLTKPSIARSS